MKFNWKPDRNLKSSLQVQIADYIRSLIHSGALLHNDPIPSQRQLQENFGVSRNTIIAALTDLTFEGLIAAHPKSGYRVFAPVIKQNLSLDWNAYLNRSKFYSQRWEYRFWADINGFSIVIPNKEFPVLPYLQKAAAYSSISKATANDSIGKYGFQPLRENITKHLGQHGLTTTADNVLICSEILPTLMALYTVLGDKNLTVLYARPNLYNAINEVGSMDFNINDLPMDEFGIKTDELKKALKKQPYSVLQVDSCEQCPTGSVMNKRRREEIMRITSAAKIPIIEFDYFRDFWYGKPFPPALKSMEGGQNVIYIGSIPRTYPVDIHLVWVVADRLVIEYLCNILIQRGNRVDAMRQFAANDLFASGLYNEMTADFRSFLSRKRQLALELCQKYLGSHASWIEKNCGFNFWLEFPKNNIRRIFNQGEIAGCYPGFFLDKTDTNHILFCPASISDEEMEDALKTIMKRLHYL